MMAEKAARVPEKAYLVNSCEPGDLTEAERTACGAIVEAGGAVRPGSAARGIPLAKLLSIARLNGEIVGVGTIKRMRPTYAERIASRSGADFPPETPELGYVVVDLKHQGNGLSHRLTEELLAKHSGSLFATTSSDRMIATLTSAGFERKGHDWPGRHAPLSFWWKDGGTPKGKT
jgi:hypothetical protein